MGIKLIKNMSDFERGLETWFALPLADRTWVRFKTHFEAAHANLKKICGPSMQNTLFLQTANAITSNYGTSP